MKSILFVLNIYPGIGGIESVTNSLADYLHNHYKVYTLSLTKVEDVSAPLGVTEAFVFPGEDADINKEYFNRLVNELNISLIVNQGMFLHMSDIIFNSDRNKAVPVVSCLHGMPGYEKHLFWGMPFVKSASQRAKRRWRIKMLFNRCKPYNQLLDLFKDGYHRIFKESTRVVLLCNEYIAPFCEYYKLDSGEHKVMAIPNPLPEKYTKIAPVEWESKRNEILFVGRVCPEKRIDLLLKMWSKVKSKNDWTLVIVGEGESLPDLKKLVISLNIDNVEFRPFTKTPEDYYIKAKFIALTSKFEGLPMSLIEAMRYGVIPVAFNISDGVRSIVENSGGTLIAMDKKNEYIKVLNHIVSGIYGCNNISQQVYQASHGYVMDIVGKEWRKLIELLTSN
ncbi:MAG: glycosyltransferase [Paramuribaculum sp.]|nr:glycosyltransferase [Paramuribaculum sp.]